MKTKVLQLLKPKTASLGFTTEELDGVADNIAKALKEDATDEQINQAIDSVLPFLQMSQKAVTRIVNAKEEKSKKEREEEARKKAEEEEAAKKAKEKGAAGGKDDEEPAWFKTYREQQDAKFAAIDSERVSAKRIADFESVIKDLPDKQKASELSTFKRLVSTFKDDDDFNSYMEEKKTSIGEIVQENANIGLGGLTKPGGGSGKTGDKPASEAECDAIVERIM
jgi:hypothetical protein